MYVTPIRSGMPDSRRVRKVNRRGQKGKQRVIVITIELKGLWSM